MADAEARQALEMGGAFKVMGFMDGGGGRRGGRGCAALFGFLLLTDFL